MNILYYKNEFNMSIGFQFLSKSFDNGTINKISYEQIKTFLYYKASENALRLKTGEIL